MQRSLFVVLLAACGGSSSPEDGMIIPAPDMATNFCVGTPVAGTCVQTFLSPLAQCLDASGTCTSSGTNTSGKACWASGGEQTFTTASAGSGVNLTISGVNGGTSCYANVEQGSSSSPFTIMAPSGGMLTYYPSTGMVICPNNTTLSIPSYGGCDAFRTLVVGPDFSTCTAGSCP